jgi:hypothetical protein
MTFLCILFVPPLCFLVRKKWGGFFLNAVLYGLALLCLISIVGIVIAPIFWLLAVGHAGFAHRRDMAAEHADLVATKLAEKMAPKH